MLLMLAAAVGVLAWLMRRGAGGMSGAASSMRVVAVQHLGPRERVVVLSVGSRNFLLGHTAHQVSMLAELSAEDLPPQAARIPENLFADLLKKLKR
jgi:flagellar protein FliO/FliZ